MGFQGATFVIQELLPASAVYRGGDAARFEWDAQHHDIPRRGWMLGVDLRTKRTDYPGAQEPTEQVLGSNLKPFTLEGSWRDKWRQPGYADLTRRQFEALVVRGNQVRLEYRGVTAIGLITSFEADYRWAGWINYEFTVSTHRRGEADILTRPRSPRTTLDPRSHQLQLKRRLQELPVSTAPPNFGGNPLANAILGLAADFNNAVADIADAVDAAALAPIGDVANAMKVLASSFTVARGRAQLLIDKLGAIRSDVGGARTSFAAATMDAWVRGLLLQARQASSMAWEAENDVVRRAEPDILTIHEARAGESLYAIALRYYNTADAWRTIAQRNGLEGFALAGGELLIIPEGPRR